MSPHQRSIGMMIFVMSLWGSTFLVTKRVIAEVPPFTLALLRVVIAALLLLPLAWWKRRRAVDAQVVPWRTLVAMGFIGVAVYYLAFNLALEYTSASQGALVQSCIPAMTALVAVLWLREHCSRLRMSAIALSVIGVLIVFTGDNANGAGSAPLLGNLWMFGTVLAWAIYTSLAKRAGHADPLLVTAYITGIGALILLPAAVLELSGRPLPRPDLGVWLGIVFLGAIASGVAYLLYNRALQDMDASEAGVFANLIPIVGVLTGVLAGGEALPLRSLAGAALVLIGVWMLATEKSQDDVSRQDAKRAKG